MKTTVIVCLTMLGIATTAQAQRNGGRVENNERTSRNNERTSNRDFRPEHNQARCNVVVRPLFPRVEVRMPNIVIERNSYRRYPEPVCDTRNILSDEELCRINRNLQTMRMDNEKVAFLKDQIDYVFLTSGQLSNLLYNITFEDNRLELAKYAYRKTIDPQNYGLVYNTLTFNSTKRDLDIFIDNQSICRR